MTPGERVDAAIETILVAAGTSLKNYSLHKPREEMRKAMRNIMSDSYIKGSNACWDAMKASGKLRGEQ